MGTFAFLQISTADNSYLLLPTLTYSYLLIDKLLVLSCAIRIYLGRWSE